MRVLSSIAETKDNLPKVIHQVESGNDICITRHGKPVAMLVSMERYNSKFGEEDDGLFGAIMAWRNLFTEKEDDLFSDMNVDALRDKGAARDFSWD